MNRILVRMELGTVDAPMPDFTQPMAEFRRKAEAVGIAVKPSLKVTDVLERPEAWNAPPGTQGYVAFLGNTTSREDAAALLSQIKVAAPAVISAKFLSLAEAEQFQAEARRISELRKKQQAAAQMSTSGRHAAQATLPRGDAAGTPSGEPFELQLTTPDDARKTPLDISELAAQ